MSATAVQIKNSVTTAQGMTFGRVVNSYVTEAKYETVRMLRAPGFSIPILILPVALYLLFGALIFGSQARSDPKVALNLFAAFTVFGMVGPGLFGFGTMVAVERDFGLLRFKRALPMPAASYLLAKLCMCLAFGMLVILAVDLSAFLVRNLPLNGLQTLNVSIISVLGGLPFCAMGLFISTLIKAQSASGVLNLIYFPMLYLSGIFFPLPKFLSAMAPIWPTYHLLQLSRWAMGVPDAGSPVTHALILAALTVVLMALGANRLARNG